MLKAKLSGPTPPEVVRAIGVIAKYLRDGGWVEVIIVAEGGASFHLSSIYELVFELTKALKEEGGDIDESDSERASGSSLLGSNPKG